MKKSPLRKKGKSDVAKCKDRIQKLLRSIVIIRDGGCILRTFTEAGKCGGYRDDGELILQFDHLHSRANSASYGISDLGVCVCLRHHFYFKKQYPAMYEELVRRNIGEKRCQLLDRVRADKRPHSFSLWDWQKIELWLKKELSKYE